MRIGIAGTHCCGKSTLAKSIAEKYPAPFITKVADKFSKTDRTSLETQYDILKALIREEKKNLHFINDRTVIDALAYFNYRYRLGEKNSITAPIYGKYMNAFIGYIQTKPYDLIIYVDDALPIEDNGTRDLENNQNEIWENIDTMLPFYSNMFSIPYIKVRGATHLRMKKIDKAVKNIYSQKRVDDFVTT